MLLESKVALVVGGAGGIGSGIAKSVSQAGALSVIADLNRDAGLQYAEAIVESGKKSQFSLRLIICSVHI